MAFLKSPRTLPSLILCGKPLPGVDNDKLKHLGNTIANVIDGCQLDLKVKNSKEIDLERFNLSRSHTYSASSTSIVFTTTTSLGHSCGVLEAGRWIRCRPNTTGPLR